MTRRLFDNLDYIVLAIFNCAIAIHCLCKHFGVY